MIALTDDMRQRLARAVADGYPAMMTVVDGAGQPHLSFRGTLQVVDDQRLGCWVRKADGNFIQAITANPKVAAMYRHAKDRVSWQFHGRAYVESDEALRARVFEGSPEIEQQQDPERQGACVLIDVDRVFERGQLIMEREGER